MIRRIRSVSVSNVASTTIFQRKDTSWRAARSTSVSERLTPRLMELTDTSNRLASSVKTSVSWLPNTSWLCITTAFRQPKWRERCTVATILAAWLGIVRAKFGYNAFSANAGLAAIEDMRRRPRPPIKLATRLDCAEVKAAVTTLASVEAHIWTRGGAAPGAKLSILYRYGLRRTRLPPAFSSASQLSSPRTEQLALFTCCRASSVGGVKISSPSCASGASPPSSGCAPNIGSMKHTGTTKSPSDATSSRVCPTAVR
mmetsp:Transcript_9671/g.17414  ORF Transcript_9671/g.17414 Transcript_9671/m.17414 type:complete len:257 (-) Transcript_9671:242-1012(-)